MAPAARTTLRQPHGARVPGAEEHRPWNLLCGFVHHHHHSTRHVLQTVAGECVCAVNECVQRHGSKEGAPRLPSSAIAAEGVRLNRTRQTASGEPNRRRPFSQRVPVCLWEASKFTHNTTTSVQLVSTTEGRPTAG